MATPTGAISLNDVRIELGVTGAISLNDPMVRSLAGIASGPISLAALRGKSSGVVHNIVSGQGGSNPIWRGYTRGDVAPWERTINIGSIDNKVAKDGHTIEQFRGRSNSVNELTIVLAYVYENGDPPYTKVRINGVQHTLGAWSAAAFTPSKSHFYSVSTTTVSGIYSLLVSGANIVVELE